jgi:hypothetical protein
MTTRTDFTDAEWDLLTDLPRIAAFGATAVEEGGPMASTRELWAGMMELAQTARTRYPNNTLIQDVVRSVSRPADDDELPMTGWKPNSGEQLGNAIVAQTLDMATRAREVLADQSTPLEAAEYTEWVLGIARASCQAVRTGLFGLTGESMTVAEDQYIKDLAAALGGE